MQIEFDPAKDVLNIKNHGLSLAMAAELEWDLLISHADDSRHDYYEQRMVGCAPIGNDVCCVVFVGCYLLYVVVVVVVVCCLEVLL